MQFDMQVTHDINALHAALLRLHGPLVVGSDVWIGLVKSLYNHYQSLSEEEKLNLPTGEDQCIHELISEYNFLFTEIQ